MLDEVRKDFGLVGVVLLNADECILFEGPGSKKAAKGVSFVSGCRVRVDRS